MFLTRLHAGIIDHLAVGDVAQGAQRGGRRKGKRIVLQWVPGIVVFGVSGLPSKKRLVSPSSIPDKPRRDAVAAFLLTTGHDCLATHLHRLGISTKPFSSLCDSGEVMERDHLLRCGALQGLTEVSRYWEARALLEQ
ncbi:hypothetical protein AVEN_243106-1 [Araneus ventricosus]|uniref:Uncharacterized protein n=1 Tax=Araneus ventricosus TaxID=182803 RepID=A0A4Y2I0W6_ARAVE|nr:hypothetical protein AVEN_243106-1 [Araneus ventricosus]